MQVVRYGPAGEMMMAEYLDYDDIAAMTAPYKKYINRKATHGSSPYWFRITGVHVTPDKRVEFTYRTFHKKPVQYSRPVAELVSGDWIFKAEGE